ncbi:hypothetical protein [Cellulosimicrobium cellulans]|uniref:hypothetical protein n=1 Tax=Cellulosimicrobium cellulans TaxID=1710 RepID=UPI0020CC2C9F|nr:hypothetical protein NMQ07_13165 [Cellulosimicrobium cellulans]
MHTRPGAARALLPVLALAATAACAAPAPSGTSPGSPTSATSAPAPDATTGSPDDAATATETASAEEAPEGQVETPEESFRAWLAASRAPDVEVACGYLAPELVDRMVAEMTAQGWPGITDCASMTTTTAGLYAAVGDVPDVEVGVREARADATVLSVVYDGGDCGTAVMVPQGARWVVTEQSEEEC